MRLLVFGHSGQVATELRRQGGAAVTALGRADADLSDPEACARAVDTAKADAVINAAAWTAVDKAEAEEHAAIVINAEAPAAMARAAAARGLPFVQISTDYVFPGTGAAPWRPGDATAPLNAYGRSKRLGEERVGAAGGPHAILRTSWVVSAHGANFVKTMLRLGAERESLSIVADQIGGPTPAADIAHACRVIAEHLARAPDLSGTYHFAAAPEVSWADFAREIFVRADLTCAVADIPTAEYPTPARRPLNSRLDCSATATAFGLARPDWRAGLGDILRELGAA
ncbi:dTDP-4-dehydrorhamnose reductase [Rhodosalinus sediminis]|uniref:dTDP-4-dehydrorhamnose reductase n=1 Tax=Rhodosalinus sediminis TaxID=1940533 RepID=A0A3D9BWB9_9RHOB|nr:dTDP-4-dehydrorhamnose reductase [Rhodosalinus sediminis]REC57814.1 dTDP-4-dehydrorhamnose reductase [Rhodosalinus sediminis]